MSLKENRLLKLLGVSIPISNAPMAGVAGSSLAAQVTLAGGFGFLGAGKEANCLSNEEDTLIVISAAYMPEKLEQELEIVRQVLKTDRNSTLRIGAGFLGWWLDKDEQKGKEVLKAALDNRVLGIWLAFGNNLQKWIQFIQDYDSRSGRKTVIFVQLSSVEDALVAMNDWKVDVIVAQGVEAGGHGFDAAPPLKSLISSITSIIPNDGPVIVGAGGLANGEQIAEILSLGASGVVLGTRFCLTPESTYPDHYKQALIAASSTASVRSAAFDQVGNWLEWPSGVGGRGLRNATVDEYEKGEDVEVLRTKYHEALRDKNLDRIIIWAGAGIGLMKDIKPAKELVQELYQECLSHLESSTTKS